MGDNKTGAQLFLAYLPKFRTDVDENLGARVTQKRHANTKPWVAGLARCFARVHTISSTSVESWVEI